MNFPGPVEFIWLLFLALFFSWIKAVGGLLALFRFARQRFAS